MDPIAADDHAAGRAADAIPVVLDPFVLRLVPTSRAVRTVRRLGHDPAARLQTTPPSQSPDTAQSSSPGTAQSSSPGQDTSAGQPADAADSVSPRQSAAQATDAMTPAKATDSVTPEQSLSGQPAPADQAADTAQPADAADCASARQSRSGSQPAPAAQPHAAAESASAGESSDTAGAADDGRSGRDTDDKPGDDEPAPISPEQVRDHLRRRAIFLRELAEARELRERVTPHRARRARIHAALRRRTFRLN